MKRKRIYTDKERDEWQDIRKSSDWDSRNIEPNLSPKDVLINLAGWGAIIAIVIAMIWLVLR